MLLSSIQKNSTKLTAGSIPIYEEVKGKLVT